MTRIAAKRGRVMAKGTRADAPTSAADPFLRVPLLRRVRIYRRAGVLVPASEFLGRRTACGGCERARPSTEHSGLYGCGLCSACSGGPDRMLTAGTTCPRKLWLTSPRRAGA